MNKVILSLSRLTVDESQVSIGPLNRQMSLDEAYIVLGVEGGAQHDDQAIMVAYNELVVIVYRLPNSRSASSLRGQKISKRRLM